MVGLARLSAGLLAMLLAWSGQADARSVQSRSGPVSVETIADGLDHPWGMDFLPDGRLLVTERPGRLRILGVDGSVSPPLAGTPEVFGQGHGGLLDIALHPEFPSNRLVYLSFVEPGEEGASLAVGRGRFAPDRIEDFRVIFRAQPAVTGSQQFGGRIAFSPEGDLFIAMGDRFRSETAQDLSTHLGAIVRVKADGTVPRDNPFAGCANAKDEIWTYGHRNIGAIAFHPESGRPWAAEMGPRGGDELNVLSPGGNYGWPLVSWGSYYDGTDIPDPPTQPRFVAPVMHWTPVISPSGMVFYTGTMFDAWRGDLLVGGLTTQELVRLEVQGRRVTEVERLSLNARIRDLMQAPDGSVYVLTDEDSGAVWRLAPSRAGGPSP